MKNDFYNFSLSYSYMDICKLFIENILEDQGFNIENVKSFKIITHFDEINIAKVQWMFRADDDNIAEQIIENKGL